MYIFFPVNCVYLCLHIILYFIFSVACIFKERLVILKQQPITTILSINTTLFTLCVTLYREPNRILQTFVLIKC